MQVSIGNSWFRSGFVGASLILTCLTGTLPAASATLTASAADIQAFDLLNATSTPTFTYSNYSSPPPTGKFTVAWSGDPTSPVDGIQTAEVGVDPTSISSAFGDVFKLVVHNGNENPWDFQLVINGVAGALVTIVNGASAVLEFDLIGQTITSFGVQVSGILPINGDDRTAEFSVSAIPLPPALLLFASGVAGLGLLGRRRQKKTSFAVVAHS